MRSIEERQQLFYDNLGLPYHIAERYGCPYDQRDDMIQEGMLVLWKATETYDENMGFKFTSFAGRGIMRAYNIFTAQAFNSSGLSATAYAMRKAYNAAKDGDDIPPQFHALTQTALSTDYKARRDASDDDGGTLGDITGEEDDYSALTQGDIRDVVHAALDKLRLDDRRILWMRFGLGGRSPMTYRESGEELGISEAMAGFCTRNALENLEKYLPNSARDLLE